MKITYALTTKQSVSCATVPSPMRVEDVDITWELDGNVLTGVDLVMRSQTVQRDPSSGAIIVRDSARDVVAFRVATFLADAIYALSGIDAFDPQHIFTHVPSIEAETPQEVVVLSQTTKRNAIAISARAALARLLNGTRIASGQPHSLAVAHYAQAMRASDPFEKFEGLYKVVEAVAPQHLSNTKLDAWVSGQARGIDPAYTPTRMKELRELRNRITHPQARLGHLSPNDLQHIQEASANLADIERLARVLIWGTPTPWI